MSSKCTFNEIAKTDLYIDLEFWTLAWNRTDTHFVSLPVC